MYLGDVERMSRREAIKAIAAAGAWTWMTGCAGTLDVEELSMKDEMPVTSIVTSNGVRVHSIQTGWVSVKELHRELSGPESLRMARILYGSTWTQKMPIMCWVIEHPEGVIVVDAGETAKTKDPAYFECDRPTRYVYERILRLDVEESWEVGPQLLRLGIDPADVRWVISTHLHSDHMGGLYHFPTSTFITSQDFYGASGTLPCRYPEFFTPQIASYSSDLAMPGFSGAMSVTRAGDVLIIPTPGHSKAHQSVALVTPERMYLFAGDTTFDEKQLRDDKIGGISEHPDNARDSLARLRELCTSRPVVYMPSHDPQSAARLRDAQVYASA